MGITFQDRVATYPNRYKVTKADGTSEYVTLERADEPIQVGTPLNADTFNGAFDEVKGMASLSKGSAPRNLLDNSDFRTPVNQRGQTSYKGKGYGIDRWYSEYDTNLVTIEDGYISMGVNPDAEPTKAKTFYQNVQNVSSLVGKTLTICAKIRGEDIQFSGTDLDYCPYITSSDWVIYHYSFTVSSNRTSIYVGIRTFPENLCECEWIALYEGEYTEENLPEYQPKGYAQELLACNVADTGNVSGAELLWENASPSSEFSAQTVAVNNAGYDLILILAKENNNREHKVSVLVENYDSFRIMSHDGYNEYRRGVIGTGSISFEAAYYVPTYGEGTANHKTSASYLIPTAIYGIKGVK